MMQIATSNYIVLFLLSLTLLSGCDKLVPVYVFDMTRLAADGTEYKGNNNYLEQPWPCVRDNKSGLIWEVKTTAPGLHAATNTYTWYRSDKATNGGWEGKQNGGTCTGSRCDTEDFVAAVNAERLCGYSDWRLPSRTDLSTIVDVTIRMPGPTVPVQYLPNTQSGLAGYYSSTPFRMHESGAWAWRMDQAFDFVARKERPAYAILVRGTAKTTGNEKETKDP
jgi:hypothetical protein